MAEMIVAGTKLANEFTDPYVLFVVGHVKARAMPNTPGFNTSIATAAGIYHDDVLLRIEVEARIYAGQSDQEIEKAVGMPDGVMLHYRALFFDVWPGAGDYLAKHVTGFRGFQEFRNHEVREFILAQVAQGGGPIILEEWLKAMRTAHRTGESLQLSDYLRSDSKVDPSIQREVAIACLPSKGLWDEWWCQIGARRDEEERDTNPQSKAIKSLQLQVDVTQAARAVLAGATSPPVDKAQAQRSRTTKRKAVSSKSKKNRPLGVKELQMQLQELIRSL